jgi:hypothetical protein
MKIRCRIQIVHSRKIGDIEYHSAQMKLDLTMEILLPEKLISKPSI